MICMIILLLRAIPIVNAALTYCSSQNTGTFKDNSIFMSNGLCLEQCSGYAFAIVQSHNCYCSNYMPSIITSLSQCDDSCPGYPADHCASDGYFGYINLQAPSGTLVGTSSRIASTSSLTSPTASSAQNPSTSIPNTLNPSASTTKSSKSIGPSTSIIRSTNIASNLESIISFSSQSTSQTSVLQSIKSKEIISSSLSSSSSSSSVPIVSSNTGSSITSDSTSTSATLLSIAGSASSASSVIETAHILTSMIYSVSTITQDRTQTYVTSIGTTVTLKIESSTTEEGVIPSKTGTSSKSVSPKNKFWGDKGKVAGVFTAVGVISLILITLLIFILMKCCQNDFEEDEEGVIPADSGVITSPELIEKPSPLIGVKAHEWSKNGKRPSYIQNKLSFIHHSEDDLSSSDDTILNDRSRKSSYGWLFGAAKYDKKGPPRHTRNSSIASNTEYEHPVIDINGDVTFIDPKVVLNSARFEEEDDVAVLSLSDFPDYSRRVFKVTNPDANESCHSSFKENLNNF